MKNAYLVIGVMNTGSCSLTFPEDFDVRDAYLSKERAQEECDRLNAETEEFSDDEEGEEEPERMEYEVFSIKIIE